MSFRILDLFCCAGGAGRGYADAGFEVVGVDINPQPRYPYKFIQADALNMLDTLLLGGTTNDARTDYVVGWGYPLGYFDAIHASPPCQRYSVTKNFTGKGDTHPDLVGPVRDRLMQIGKPWVIENVPGAPLIDPVTLCGSHFGLSTDFDGRKVGLQRHRLFESNILIPDPGPHDHSLPSITVAGHDVPSHQRKFGKSVPLEIRKTLMQIDWMSRDQLGQAIPPAYTEYVGRALIEALETGRA